MATPGSAESFRHAFQEEAHEILVDLESALLELNERTDDMELVGRVFRGLHTIKGSGAMFGFDELANFTHKLENAFDEVRNGRLAVSAELVDLTLSALDQIKAMVEEQPAAQDAVTQIQDRLLQMTGEVGAVAMAAIADTRVGGKSAASGIEHAWRIRFAPGPCLMRYGSDPFLLVRELGRMGALEVAANMDAVPALADLDPERCYISWDMVLHTSATHNEIRDVFIFVEDCCELSIEAIASQTTQPADCEADKTAKALDDPRSKSGGRRSYDSADSASSIRVPAAKLDHFVNLVGELVTVQARLSELAASRDDVEITAVAEDVERLASALRENSMNIRMMPIRSTFEKFRRLVHDLARDLGKAVELTIEGAETELDKTVIDHLGDPLMHLIRNSMDHGIEPPGKRTAQGKPPLATIHLSARYSGASVLIGVSDDGRGIDTGAVRARAIEKGLIAPESVLSDSEIYALIFQPGFSTAQQVTDISGRGVGMDVVRKSVEGLRGSIEVVSKPGAGTTVTLKLPLTLAIIDGLLVTVGRASFVLPLVNTLECIELSRDEIDRAEGKRLINVRGEIVPYIRLREHFGIDEPLPDYEQVMVVETEDGRYGLIVDQVLGNCQTVIKSLGRVYQHIQIVSGATILGNGTVALILDPQRLVQEGIRSCRLNARGHPRASNYAKGG